MAKKGAFGTLFYGGVLREAAPLLRNYLIVNFS